MRLANWGLLAAAAFAATTAPSAAAAETALYRYSLSTGALLNKYAQRLSGRDAAGPYYRVTTDAKGKITSVEFMRGGSVLRKFDYFYQAGETNAFKQASFVKGEQLGYELVTYYPDGKTKRIEAYTSLGKLTRYQTCEPVAGGVRDCSLFAPDGKLLRRTQSTFGASGYVVSEKSWKAGDTSYHLATYDPTNGLEVENHLIRFTDGKVLNIAKSAYDSTGDLTRIDGYDNEGKSALGSIQFRDGLATKKSIRRSDGSTYEVVHQYDAKRMRTGSDVLINGKLTFRLAYVRESNGTIIKTQALGLDGELWAEYPGAAIDEVFRTGAASGNPELGVVYRKEPWW